MLVKVNDHLSNNFGINVSHTDIRTKLLSRQRILVGTTLRNESYKIMFKGALKRRIK